VAVWTEGGKKQFELDEALRPSAFAYCAGFAASVTPALARAACGDVWAHAIEGFLSPLASDELRGELAALVGELLALPIAADARWFAPSGRAAALQARSSVGLVHGLAHVLEPALARVELGHARLCSLFLAPVLRWSATTSSKWNELTAQYGIDRAAVEAVALGLTDAPALRELAPAVEAHWRTILRDPCTRTSSVLVRPDSLAALVAAMNETAAAAEVAA
jgi:alcohol dehydrogenase class IV